MAQFGRWLQGGLLAITMVTGVAGARAQVVTDPVEVSICLCLGRERESRLAEMTVRRNAFDALARDISAREAALDALRPKVDVNDPAAVEGFRQQLAELDALKSRQDLVTLPDYQAALNAYNDRVGLYAQRCAGRQLDPAAIERALATLSCPVDQ